MFVRKNEVRQSENSGMSMKNTTNSTPGSTSAAAIQRFFRFTEGFTLSADLMFGKIAIYSSIKRRMCQFFFRFFRENICFFFFQL